VTQVGAGANRSFDPADKRRLVDVVGGYISDASVEANQRDLVHGTDPQVD